MNEVGASCCVYRFNLLSYSNKSPCKIKYSLRNPNSYTFLCQESKERSILFPRNTLTASFAAPRWQETSVGLSQCFP